jgi:hypothetical protein
MQMGVCKHFRGTAAQICAAGVAYAEAAVGNGRPRESLPCFAQRLPCKRREYPTREDVEAAENDAAWGE